MNTFTCTDCGADFAWDESPVDDLCVGCLTDREWYYGETEATACAS